MPATDGSVSRPEQSLVVQQSFPDPRPTTNPYIVMLAAAIRDEPGVLLQTFSWRRALLSRYDVFHAHWPEILVSAQNPLKTLVRQFLTGLLLIKLWLWRIPVVRTAHNIALPSGLSRRQRMLLRGFERLTVLRIRLNPSTVLPEGTEVATIVHGHYRDWFSGYRRSQLVPGRLGYFGLIRRYKNLEQLLTAFAAVPGRWSLRVGGKPSDERLVGVVAALAAADDRVLTKLEYLEDAEVVELVTESELIVLPYREMHNSGAALTALSLGRPVLVPGNEVNDRLADEVGSAWVLRYPGEFTGEALQAALAELRSTPPVGTPDLSTREWSETGRHHVEAYRRAISLRRGRGVADQR